MDAANEINQLKHLPPLSPTASRLIQMVADDDIDLTSLAQVIEQDPGLAARIIGLANSAYFALPNPVNNVEQAIIRVLGLNLVKSLALGIAVAGAFDVEGCPGFDLQEYWYKALASAQLGRLLAMQIAPAQRPDPDAVHLGGLFHNLGALLLAHVAGKEYAKVLQAMAETPALNRQHLERELLGIDELQAGQLLAKRWHLPDTIAKIMGEIGNRDYQGDHQIETCLVNSAVDWIEIDGKGGISLHDDSWLLELPGMDKRRVAAIEAGFLETCEQLKQVAADLS